MTLPRRFAAAVSEHPVVAQATGEVLGQVLDVVGHSPDVAVLFASGHHVDRLAEIVDAVASLLAPSVLVGSAARSVIGNAREPEGLAALSLWVGRIPDALPIRLTADGDEGLRAVQKLPASHRAGTLLLLADPSAVTEAVLTRLAVTAPQLAVVGGVASATVLGGNRLVLDGTIHRSGAVGFAVAAGVIDTLVSQGSRPVGAPFIVTSADGEVVTGLGGRPAAVRLREMLAELDDETRALAGRGLDVGIAVDERQADFQRGDFVVRELLGTDVARRGVVLPTAVEVGRTLQFHVRDARIADEDLRSQLFDRTAEGALLFTSSERGRAMFGVDDHDASTAHELLGSPAIAGMACDGEIGPIGRGSHLHRCATSMALF